MEAAARLMTSPSFGSAVALTLADILRRNRDFHPGEAAYVFRDHGGREHALNWEQLWAAAAARAGGIVNRLGTGRKLMLVLEPGLDFVELFFAVELAGCVPVPMSARFGAGSALRLRQVCSASRIDGVIVDAANERFLAEVLADMAGADRPLVLRLFELAAPPRPLPAPSPTAFLQYTSGSTGTPKPLAISHANLLRNLSLMATVCDARPMESTVSWLPPHHDFGLIGGILFPAFICGTGVLFSPTSFVRRPRTWLELIAQHRAAFTGSPNFGYELTARRVTDVDGLYLGSLRVAINGAERIDPETLRGFCGKFAAAGLRADVVRPCYGLAEATLLVTGARAGAWHSLVASRRGLEDGVVRPAVEPAAASDGVELVANGPPVVDHLAIVRDGNRVENGVVGEIWVADACVSASAEPRTLAVADRDGDAPAWIATGDRGAIVADELYVVGRMKELVIRAGQNIYLDDVDASVARAMPGASTASVCAFRVPDSEEIAIVVEQRRASAIEMLTADVSAAVHATYGFAPVAVLVVPPGGIPRTTSGKKQRHRCARLLTVEPATG